MKARLFLAAGLVLGLSSIASAATLTVKKDGTGDYTTIQDAIDNATSGDEIVVYPGLYQENLNINTLELTVRAIDGPLMTVIDGVLQQDGQLDTIVVNDGTNLGREFTIIGFTITRGFNGMYIHDRVQSLVANCVFHENSNDGLVLENLFNTPGVVTATVHNNVFLSNGGNGIHLSSPQTASVLLFPMSIKNNIIIDHSGTGFVATHSSGEPADETEVVDGDLVDFDYNALKQNDQGAYGAEIGQTGNHAIQIGVNNTNTIFFSQHFVGTAPGYGFDVRLSRDPENFSDAIDAGQESAGAKDPDGTRNDMGALGGPFASTFFESPIDGPVVTSVVVTPANVPQGTDFSISATVSVR